jgi:solute carrier family 25 phosphate transporter 3
MSSTQSVVPAKKWDARYAGKVPHTSDYYIKCLIGGALACGLTHTAVTPLDVVKCNMQVNPKKYTGLVSGMRTVLAEEGAAGIWKGWLPTSIGYHLQGTLKFGLNEMFKDTYANLAGEKNAQKYRAFIWAGASASAEFFADIALCPMEMVKVKVQTSPAGTWPTRFGPALSQMYAQRAETRFPFGSVVPLWSRQIPYTVAKFVGFEFCVEQFYKHVFTNPKDTYSKATQLGITFASGYIAGVACAIISQPADNLVSQMGKAENRGKSFGQMASEQGIKNLFTRGLGTRIIMIGTLTGLQWWIYDTWKTAMGLGTSGGEGAQKK